MSDHLVNLLAGMAFFVMPSQVLWSYIVGAVVFAIGMFVMFRSGDWQRASASDKLILLGPVFYAAPLAAFGTEHFTITNIIASLIPKWIPWHTFWAYLVGACFILAALSLVTRIQPRLAASLLALTFFLFVALMDAPGAARRPDSRFAIALMLRELCFGAGPLALAATLSGGWRERSTNMLAMMARYFLAVTALYYSFEQFLHADHVPGIPLPMVTPTFIFGHSIWTYVTATVSAISGVLLLIGKKTRAAATWLGLTLLLGILVVYIPIAVMKHTDLEGLNYFFDTLMFCGTVLLVAGAMPREAEEPETARQVSPSAGVAAAEKS